MKAGTKITFEHLADLNGRKVTETATIRKWTKVMGSRDDLPAGYHPVRFEDGGTLMMHESSFTVLEGTTR